MRPRDVIVGMAMTGAGLGYLRLAGALPERDGVDAATVPTILAWMMIGLGAIELVGALRRPDDERPKAASGGLLTVALTLALIACYIAALPVLGFPIATALYLFLQFLVLSPPAARPPVAFCAGLAVAAAAIIFATFRYGFDLLLPAGPLVAWLN